MRIKANNGYSLIMWVSVFAVLLITIGFVQTSLKRTICKKNLQTSDYVLWTMWNQDVVLEPTEKTSRTKSAAIDQQSIYTQENKGGETVYGSDSGRGEVRISTGVEEGSESLLNALPL